MTPDFFELLSNPAFRALLVFRTNAAAENDARRFAKGMEGAVLSLTERRATMPSGASVLFGICDGMEDTCRFAGCEFQYVEFVEAAESKKVFDYFAARCRSFDGIERQLH